MIANNNSVNLCDLCASVLKNSTQRHKEHKVAQRYKSLNY